MDKTGKVQAAMARARADLDQLSSAATALQEASNSNVMGEPDMQTDSLHSIVTAERDLSKILRKTKPTQADVKLLHRGLTSLWQHMPSPP